MPPGRPDAGCCGCWGGGTSPAARACPPAPPSNTPPWRPIVQIYTAGSVGGASLINEGEADVVMNWSGGMHHAKKGEASGGWPR